MNHLMLFLFSINIKTYFINKPSKTILAFADKNNSILDGLHIFYNFVSS